VLLAAGLGALEQFGDEQVWKRVAYWPNELMDWFLARDNYLLGWMLLIPALLLLATAVSRILAIALALLRDFDFTLEQAGPRLSVERGLLTRMRASAPLRRIQHWTLRQNLVLRLFGRSSLRVETAATRAGNEPQTLSDLVPIAPAGVLDALLRGWLPDWPGVFDFRPLHPRAWRRMALVPCLLTLAASASLTAASGAIGLVLLVSIPFWIWRARRKAACAGYAVTDRFVVWRSGWLDKRLSFAQIDKLQGLRWVQSPFDRRHGMAGVRIDTAGAHPLGHRLHLVCLPEAEARALFARLSIRLAKSPWQW